MPIVPTFFKIQNEREENKELMEDGQTEMAWLV